MVKARKNMKYERILMIGTKELIDITRKNVQYVT